MLVLTRSVGEGVTFRGTSDAKLKVLGTRRAGILPAKEQAHSERRVKFVLLEITSHGRTKVDLTQNGAIEFQLDDCMVRVTVNRVNGKSVVLGIQAPDFVKVLRDELPEQH